MYSIFNSIAVTYRVIIFFLLLKVKFFHNGKLLAKTSDEGEAHRYIFYPPEASDDRGKLEVRHVLQVMKVKPEDDGTYQCFLDPYTARSVDVIVESTYPGIGCRYCGRCWWLLLVLYCIV